MVESPPCSDGCHWPNVYEHAVDCPRRYMRHDRHAACADHQVGCCVLARAHEAHSKELAEAYRALVKAQDDRTKYLEEQLELTNKALETALELCRSMDKAHMSYIPMWRSR